MIILLFSLLLPFFATPQLVSDDLLLSEDLKSEMLWKINQIREDGCKCGAKRMPAVESVQWNRILEKSAYEHASDMNKKKYFSHFSRKGEDIGVRAENAGYRYEKVGENIAEGQLNVDQVIEDWLDSYDHCTLIMNPVFTEMGAARAGYHWVLHFGKQRNWK